MNKNKISNNQLQKNSSSQQFAIQTQQRTIFDPEIVEKYSRMVPDAPERILKVFEENSRVEREVRGDQIKTQLYQHVESKRRDWMGYSLAVIALAAFICFAYINKPIPAVGSFLSFAGMAVIGFIKSRKK